MLGALRGWTEAPHCFELNANISVVTRSLRHALEQLIAFAGDIAVADKVKDKPSVRNSRTATTSNHSRALQSALTPSRLAVAHGRVVVRMRVTPVSEVFKFLSSF
ncbi:hypothetical protein EYF80_004477 [Liparis tanakae]|uniref:Uncharacterized protein n=1 Tax=Liparis tanakae TaxID=230148 RepID=A0A4Z2J537_9TELE|nr:hypothetical protein EYF80_004477 [Liparis tanakae]